MLKKVRRALRKAPPTEERWIWKEETARGERRKERGIVYCLNYRMRKERHGDV